MSRQLSNGNRQDPAGEVDLTGLHRSLSLLKSGRTLIGSVPAGPATLRARIGAKLVRIIRRALFWFLPQLDTFHAAVIEFAQQQISITTKLLDHASALDEEIYLLQGNAGQSPSTEGRPEPIWEMSPQQWMESVQRRAGSESK